MDEFEQLRGFRSRLPAPDDEEVRAARSALDRAIDAELSDDSASGAGSFGIGLTSHRTLAAAAAVAVLAIGLSLAVFLPAENEDAPDQTVSPSLGSVGAKLQQYTGGDFDHLDSLGLTLRDVALDSSAVGTGRIVDIRPGYEEADGVLHMFLVVKPDRLAVGGGGLGQSGQVLVDQIAPPLDRETGTRGIAELRAAAVASPERVAFMLSHTPPSTYERSPDEFAGRAQDDPIFSPTHPSSFFALNEKAGAAFPLITDEKLENVPGNVDALRDLGAEIDRFSAGTIAFGGGS